MHVPYNFEYKAPSNLGRAPLLKINFQGKKKNFLQANTFNFL